MPPAPIPPPIPVLMLYDPTEFWQSVRQFVREEVTLAQAQTATVHAALANAHLPIKPAYSLDEIGILFQMSKADLSDWIRQGTLTTIQIRRKSYILYSDILQLFSHPHAPPKV